MNGTGSVERILVGGILVVVLAILGIAGWNASGSGDDPGSVTDGGTEAGTSDLVDAGRLADTGEPAGVQELRKNQREAKARREAAKGKYIGGGNELTAKAATGPAGKSGAAASGADEGRGASGAGRDGRKPVSVLNADPWLLAGGEPAAGVPLSKNDRVAGDETAGGVAKDDAAQDAAAQDAAAQDAAAGRDDDSVAKGQAPAEFGQAPSPYVVRDGDTLWKIAKRTYGDGDVQKMVDSIVAENPTIDPDRILPGQKLKLPDLHAVPGVITPAPSDLVADGQKRFYEVRAGDTLTDIAMVQLGARDRWSEIYALNRQRIPNPDMLHAGTTLILPRE